MRGRKRETGKAFKKENIVHSCLLLMLACCLVSNTLHLSKQKKEAQAELSRIFSRGYAEKVRAGISQAQQRDSKGVMYVLHTNPFEATDEYKLLDRPKDKLQNAKPQNKLEESPTHVLQQFVRQTVSSKLRSPFLFGFKDVAEEVLDFLKLHTFCNKKLQPGINTTEVNKNLEKYFQGTMSSEYYALVCRTIAQILISDKLAESRKGLLVKDGDSTYLNRNEYLAIAACLGEITTVLLGHRVESKIFAEDLGLSQKNLEASFIGCVLKLGTPESAMYPAAAS